MPELHVNSNAIYGTGFIALDVVLSKNIKQFRRTWAGGTCANVLIASAYLGWKATPLARLAEDSAGLRVKEDCRHWGVDLRYLNMQPQASTPIIVEEISSNKAGTSVHRFLWTCPGCGAYLPSFRPIPRKTIGVALSQFEIPAVFFFDRVSRGILQLAKYFSDQGAIVMFEPSGVGEPRLFREAVRLCHVLKFSHQRAGSFSDLIQNIHPWLQIETLGEDGLRFKSHLPLASTSRWENLGSFEAPIVRDTAGCGDWCSAGLISKLGGHGQAGLATVTERSLVRALKYGQALAAWNCQYEGARGGMYAITRTEFDDQVKMILAGGTSTSGIRSKVEPRPRREFLDICPSCEAISGAPSRVAMKHRPRKIKTGQSRY